MNAVGIIFADAYEAEINELTETRTMAALPFGARYRVIDYLLSNMTNAGIHNVGIITNSRYESLMDHVRSGIEWDLDRKNGGLHILPPFSFQGGIRYEHLLEAMRANVSFLDKCPEDYVIFCSSTCIGNVDLKAMLDYHIKSEACVTVLCTRNPVSKQQGMPSTEYELDSEGRVWKIQINRPVIPEGAAVGANTYIINRKELLHLLRDPDNAKASSWREDILMPHLQDKKIMGYETKETLLYFDNVVAFLQSNLALLDSNLRDELFQQENRPIITRVGDSAPAWYGPTSKVSNSLIAAGTVIEGEVRNSVIFRGVHIKEGAVVENSVVMRDVTIGEDAYLNYAILDKDVLINDKRMLSGYITHPFVVKYGVVI